MDRHSTGPDSRKGLSRLTVVLVAMLISLVILIAGTWLAASRLSDGQFEILLEGLSDPRGLIEIRQGDICVAEAGYVAGDIPQEAPQVREDSTTGSVVCVNRLGKESVLFEGVAHVRYSGSGVSSGAADLTEVDGQLHLLVGEAFGPYARSLVSIPTLGGSPTVVADFLEPAEAEAAGTIGDGEVRSNPYGVIYDADQGHFLVADGATGEVLRVNTDGQIDTFAPLPGHEVLTGIASASDDSVYVASFSQLPHVAGSGAMEVLVDEIPHPTSLLITASGSVAMSVRGAFAAEGEGSVVVFSELAQTETLDRVIFFRR